MIINTYKAYIATKHDGSPIVARRISTSGWAWYTVGRHGQIVSPEIPEEHLKNFSMIVKGSMKEGWATEAVYDVEEETREGEEVLCGADERQT